MRCKFNGCPNLTHYPNSAICWKKWSLCAVHARFLHPEEYSGKGHLVRIGQVRHPRKGCTSDNYKTSGKRFGYEVGTTDPTQLARKLRRDNVKFMYENGKGVIAISKAMNIPRVTVSRDLKVIKYEQLLSPRAN